MIRRNTRILFLGVSMAGLLCGCSSLFKSTEDKALVLNQSGYTFNMSSGASTSSLTPGILIGKLNSTYVSTPSGTSVAYVIESKDTAWFSGTVSGGTRLILLTGSGCAQMENIPAYELGTADPVAKSANAAEGGATDRQ